jgi:ankyrin repeat protein
MARQPDPMSTGDDWIETEKLHEAAGGGDLAAARQLLAEGAVINAFDSLGWTPLHHAARAGYIEMMRLLLAAGADVNAHNESRLGETPLGEVAGNCDYEVARVLIEAGADPTIPGWTGRSALDRAQARKRPEGLQVKELLERAARAPKVPPRRRR